MNKLEQIDLDIVKWIQKSLSSNIMDTIIYSITHLGDKFFFIFLAVVIFWAVDKKFAFKLTISFIGSAAVNVVLKNIFLRPRPYNNGAISIGPKTHGTSFPSGHSQASGVLFYSINDEYGKKYKYMRYLAIFILIMVPFSRMYLGQHYLTDVLTGSIIGIIAAIVGFKLFDLMKDKEHIYPLFVIPVFMVALIVLYSKGYDDVKDIFVAVGGYVGFVVGYAIEKLYIKHDVDTTWLNRIYKIIIGLIITASLYFGLKFIFPEESLIFDFIRYTVIAFSATAIIPYLFTKIFKQDKETI